MEATTTETAVMDVFRSIVLSSGYNDVTVTRLCQDANISRTTFYDYFSNKVDVFESLLYRDAFLDVERIFPLFLQKDYQYSPQLLATHTYRGIYQHLDFYSRMIKSGGEADFAYCIRKCVIKLQTILTQTDMFHANDYIRYARICGAGAQSALIIQWVKDNAPVSPEQFAEWTAEWTFSSGCVGFPLKEKNE